MQLDQLQFCHPKSCWTPLPIALVLSISPPCPTPLEQDSMKHSFQQKDVQLQCWVPFACIAWHEHFRAPQTSNKGSQKTIGAWRPSPETSSEEGVLGEGFCAPIVFWKPLLEVWGAPFLISPPIYYPTHPPKLLFFL